GSAGFVLQDDPRGAPVAMYELLPEFADLQAVPEGRGGVGGYVRWRSEGERNRLGPRESARRLQPFAVSRSETASLLQRAMYLLDKGLYADVYERDMLRDGRYPPAYLKSDQQIGEAQAKRYSDEFRMKYLGARQEVKGVPVLGQGMSIEPTPF